ncbi:DUF4129 domain-containing protein [Ornithinimicrobium avium]|uniref:DUF4129 domain-containing protein n=1 Tax=Ornithinimicrobium avium TaxID=2283195 RepID=A0A345NRR8_9MICO|nr:DUF4129 domain-containing protein [Ornithinimicrobium avium]AXH97726.1 DUF4129 domain-containing protein [Ornithinimicrobium avium]
MLIIGVPVDPDREEARRLLEEELSGPGYELHESFVARAWRWVADHLPALDLPARLPSWAAWAVLAGVLLVALAVVLFAARDRWRRPGPGRAAGGAVLDGAGLPAAAYRRRAADAAAAGNHADALLDAYRAVAAGAVERALLDGRPGRTAHEVAVDLAQVFPQEAFALARAADRFDAVRYGAAAVGAEEASRVVELDRRLVAARPVPAADGEVTVGGAP